MESGQTKEVSHRVKSDTTPRTLNSSISIGFSPEVTQNGDHVTNEDTEDVENQGSEMGQIQDSIVGGRIRRNPRIPTWLTSAMIVAYIFLVIKESIPSTYKEAEIS